MNELTTARGLEVIGAEIREHAANFEYHRRSTIWEAIEIGRRLVEARDQAEHGEWMKFLKEQTPFSHDKANNMIKVFEAYGDQQSSLFGAELTNSDTYQNLTYSKALALLALPTGEREDFVESHDVEAMSTRELKQAIKERDEARAEREKESERADSAEASRDVAEKRAHAAEEREKALLSDRDRDQEIWERQADTLRAKIKELEARPIDVAVQVDEDAVKKAADEARAAADAEWSAKVKEAKAEEKAKKAAEKAKTAGEDATKKNAAELEAAKKAEADAKAEADRLRAELETAKREQAKASIAGDADLAAFQLLFEQVQTDVNKMRGLLLKVRGREDSDLGEKLAKALLALADAVRRCAA